jgi:hypothetical protein
MRSAVFNSPEVITHLLALADLRDEWQSSPNRGKLREVSCGGEPLLVDASLGEQMRYRRELEASPLCDLFSPDYLDRRISVIRDRLSTGFWGRAEPPGDIGAGYGRQRGAYPSMDPNTIELAVADLVQERFGGEKHPLLAKDKVVRSKVRQVRRRLRQLASS